MESYRPESPRLLTPVSFRPGIFGRKRCVKPTGEVPEYLKTLMNRVQTSKTPKRFRPVMYWESYLLDLERTGTSKDVVDRIRKDHEECESENPLSIQKEIVDIPSDPLSVVSKLSVSKSGKVKVYLEAPMEVLHTKYYSKGKRPPIDEQLKALKKFGYPESVLLRVLEKHQRREEKSADLDLFIERIFGKGGGKVSKPKAKSVMDQLSSMLKIKR